MNNPKRTIYIDASLIKDSSCLRKICLKTLDGYKGLGRDHKMEYGSAFHLFTESFYLGASKEAAIMKALEYYTDPSIDIPAGDFRTPEHLLMTCNQYADYWQQESFEIAINANGKPVVEERFCVKVFEDECCEIWLFGKMDVVGRESGLPTIMDHKVTSSYNPDSYLAGYDLSTQLLVYDYGVRALAAEFPATFADYSDPYFLIDGIFISKSKKAQFVRSNQIHFSPEKRRWFKRMLANLCIEISFNALCNADVLYEPTGFLTGACDGRFFKPCEFCGVCREDNLEIAKLKLAGDFEQRPYNPNIYGGESEL